jgi:ribonuclease HI
MVEVTIITDGSCIGNPGRGGWACVLRCGEHTRELRGSDRETTSNRMELLAAIEGLPALRAPCRIRLASDPFRIHQEGNHRAPAQVALKWLAEV